MLIDIFGRLSIHKLTLNCLRFNVDEPDDGISGERYMAICKYKSNGERQNCPPEDSYPWLGEENHCGGNTPCDDCVAY